jgi:hypothetical protein
MELLQGGGTQAHYIITVAIRLISKMMQKEPLLTVKYFVDNLLQPLMAFTTPHAENLSSDIIVDEQDLQHCVENIHKVATAQMTELSFWSAIDKAIPSLFRLYCFCSQSKSHMKSACKDILLCFLRMSDSASAVLKATIIPTEQQMTKDKAIFTLGPSGGVVMKVAPEDFKRDYSGEADIMIGLLKDNNDDHLTGSLFVELLNLFLKLKTEIEADERFALYNTS